MQCDTHVNNTQPAKCLHYGVAFRDIRQLLHNKAYNGVVCTCPLRNGLRSNLNHSLCVWVFGQTGRRFALPSIVRQIYLLESHVWTETIASYRQTNNTRDGTRSFHLGTIAQGVPGTEVPSGV